MAAKKTSTAHEKKLRTYFTPQSVLLSSGAKRARRRRLVSANLMSGMPLKHRDRDVERESSITTDDDDDMRALVTN